MLHTFLKRKPNSISCKYLIIFNSFESSVNCFQIKNIREVTNPKPKILIRLQVLYKTFKSCSYVSKQPSSCLFSTYKQTMQSPEWKDTFESAANNMNMTIWNFANSNFAFGIFLFSLICILHVFHANSGCIISFASISTMHTRMSYGEDVFVCVCVADKCLLTVSKEIKGIKDVETRCSPQRSEKYHLVSCE